MNLPVPARLRETRLFNLLKTWVINRRYRRKHPEFRREVRFYRSLGIRRGSLVFDLGANKGYKTDVFRSCGARVVSVEPDLKSYGVLQSRFGWSPEVKLVNAAVSDRKGEEDFYVFEDGDVLNTLSMKWKSTVEHPVTARFEEARRFQSAYKVRTCTLDELVDLYGVPEYLKIDVEGYEDKVLSRLSRPVKLISFEANLPEFLEETLRCIRLLNSLDPRYRYNYAGADLEMGETWLSAIEMADFLESGRLLYCEVLAKQPG